MKSLLIVFELFLNMFCWGQLKMSVNDYSLLEQSNFWSVVVDTTAVPASNFNPYLKVNANWYKFGNDTTINDVLFKTILQSFGPIHFGGWNIAGHLRQEGKRIYFLDQTREILLYDFGLSVGETFESAIHPEFNYVSRLDSVGDTILNNSVRKIYYLTEHLVKDPGIKQCEVWIEGIGSISDGLLRQTMLGLSADNWQEYLLMCFHQDGSLIYQSKRYEISSDISGINSQKLVSPDKLWSTMTGPYFGCSSFFCGSYYTRFTSDTIIGESHYIKVLRSNDQYMQKWITQGFIREENNQKVFYREKEAMAECLLYNFGCKVGEIIHLECGCAGDYLVDSIVTKETDGIARKHFYLKNLNVHLYESEEWIEGIGSIMGILNGGSFAHCMFGGGEALLCNYDTGIKKYQSPQFPNYCYLSPEIIDGVVPGKAVSQIRVYPNPVSGELFIQATSNMNEGFTLEMYSIKGELVKTQCLEQGSTLHQIDTSSLRNGIYILRLISASGKYDEKVIIEE